METSGLRRLRELEEENRRLKQMYVELSQEHQVLKADDLGSPTDLFFLFRLAQKERTKEKGEAP